MCIANANKYKVYVSIIINTYLNVNTNEKMWITAWREFVENWYDNLIGYEAWVVKTQHGLKYSDKSRDITDLEYILYMQQVVISLWISAIGCFDIYLPFFT